MNFKEWLKLGAKNAVIAGDYNGNKVTLTVGGTLPIISVDYKTSVEMNKYFVENYELITDEHRKSAASGVSRGLVGGALLEPVGMLAGAMSAKNKGIYQIAIQFKDGKKSLIEVDDKIYKALVKACF